jgi:hypothetical protein
MGTFADRYAASQDPAMQIKAGIAAVITAIQAMVDSSDKVAVDRKRKALAMTVLSDPLNIAARFALIIAAQDVPATDPDASILAMVQQLWDPIAGVTDDDRGK